VSEGRVVVNAQSPQPGQRIRRGSAVRLELGERVSRIRETTPDGAARRAPEETPVGPPARAPAEPPPADPEAGDPPPSDEDRPF
jgi:hypothetical protein